MTITVSAKIYKVSTLAIIAPRQRSTLIKLIGMLLLFFLTLSSSYAAELKANSTKTNHTVIKLEAPQMWIKIGEHRFKATLANTSAAREFAAQLPLTLNMADLHNNEKHAKLEKSISTDTHQPKRINNGDIMLWGSHTLVLFYKNFDTSYEYTRIAHIEDASKLPQILGSNSVIIAFSKD